MPPPPAPADPSDPRPARWLWPALALLAFSALGLGLFLAHELIEGEAFAWDAAILVALRVPGHPEQTVGPAWLLQSAIDVSALGGFTLRWLFGVAGLAWLAAIRRRADAAWLAISVFGSSLLDTLAKDWVARPRPTLVPHLAQVTDTSFPSGHAMAAAATYLTLALMLGRHQKGRAARLAIVAFFSLIVVLVGASRVFLGVHWPSDVLAGWAFGAVWALAVFAASRRLSRGGR